MGFGGMFRPAALQRHFVAQSDAQMRRHADPFGQAFGNTV
jgi:hypothetical protein